MTDENPFVPGARVAVRSRYGDDMTEAFVDKVRKNGNFTLRGSTQQWRPWCNGYGDRTWGASETCRDYSRRSLRIWDETTDAEIRSRIAATQLKTRWYKLQDKVRRIQNPSVDLCDQIETAMSAFEGREKVT